MCSLLYIHWKWRVLAFAIAIVYLVILGYVVWWVLNPIILTRMHADELRPYVQKYLELTTSIQGWSDPGTIAQVETGKALDYGLQTRCVNCSSVQITTAIHIVELEVFDYSETSSTVGIRVEYAWHLVDTNNGAILGPCYAETYNTALLLKREEGVWKVADGADIPGWERNSDRTTPALQAKYCPPS